jgi:hypothetical protein
MATVFRQLVIGHRQHSRRSEHQIDRLLTQFFLRRCVGDSVSHLHILSSHTKREPDHIPGSRTITPGIPKSLRSAVDLDVLLLGQPVE